MIWPLAFSVFLYGLVAGSFATALAWRVPQGMSVVSQTDSNHKTAARSICPHCKHKLGFFDLIPLLSWLCSKGSCRHCSKKISIIYPLMELVTGLAAVGVFLSWGLSLQMVVIVMMLPFLMAMIVIDFKYMLLPDKLTLACAVLGLAHVVLMFCAQDYDMRILTHYISAGVFYAAFAFALAFLMSKILKKDAMGMGDVKFYLVAGLFLGFSYFSAFLIFSGVFGVLSALIWRKVSGKEAFPFGPALILSLYGCLVLQGLGIVPFVGL